MRAASVGNGPDTLRRVRICITGATGFIGSYFCRAYQAAGHEVVGLDLVPPDGAAPMVRFIRGDIRDADALRRAFTGCKRVLSLAAAHHDFGIDRPTYFAVNEEASRLVCEQADAAGIRRLCWYSSCAVYGDAREPRDERTEPHPVHPYGASKLAGEQVFRAWAARGEGRSVLCIRPTITFGPGNVANMYSLIRQIAGGRFVTAGAGTNCKSLSYVENLVSATQYLWERQGEGMDTFNFVEKPDLTSAKICDEIAHALGRRSAGLRLPLPLVLAMALPFDAITAVTGKDLSISTMRVRKLFVQQTRFEAQKLADAGFRSPVPLPEGLHRMVRWWSAEGRSTPPTWRQPPAQVQRFAD